ncbi:AAA family ATPase [Acinetobacter sp. V89_4]|uniref:AAA family ATPase n=1 Tax=Acinetobacter sp. V89_4 TaxID=3044232 RepID=UPI00249DFF6F|nr:AAA family ATPase [Acinetobacter sp. V89_4]MDI3455219.1 AAA family ATPase [Acinetobacter sp. V89_4]
MSFQILNYPFANKNIELSRENNLIGNNHCFTILTGKNGIGKSRLLVSIVSNYLKEKNSNELLSTKEPCKIIAISNIKTDKFPFKRNKSEKYYYFGNKSNHPYQSTDKYSIFKNLLINPQINEQSVSQTFNYLGFSSTIRISLSFARVTYINNSNQIEKYLELFEIYSDFFDNFLPPPLFNKFVDIFHEARKFKSDSYYKYNSNEFLEKNEISIDYNVRTFKKNILPDRVIDPIKESLKPNEILLLNCLYKLHSSGENITPELFSKIVDTTIFNLEFIKKSLTIYHDFKHQNELEIFNDILFLLSFDLALITDLKLFPNDSDKYIKFNDLSSGQQSLFNILLGLSGVIEDNSLICIDEPEVNLHPEWQNEFILKLQNIFNCFHGCHFIIATHSPQIVSGLTSPNGFVVDLENNITYSAVSQSKRSADFQLAKIFNSPGYNNEYIIKICLFLLSKIKDQRTFDESDIKSLKELKSFQSSMKLDDPVYYLVKEVISLSEV